MCYWSLSNSVFKFVYKKWEVINFSHAIFVHTINPGARIYQKLYVLVITTFINKFTKNDSKHFWRTNYFWDNSAKWAEFYMKIEQILLKINVNITWNSVVSKLSVICFESVTNA